MKLNFKISYNYKYYNNETIVINKKLSNIKLYKNAKQTYTSNTIKFVFTVR